MGSTRRLRSVDSRLTLTGRNFVKEVDDAVPFGESVEESGWVEDDLKFTGNDVADRLPRALRVN